MDRRSTNDIGYVHYQGDVVSNVGSSHGVRLTGGSTGAAVEAFGDDTSIALRVRGKNAGGLLLGGGSTGSTSPVTLIERYFVEYTVPALSSGPATGSDTVTVTGLTTNSILVLQNRLRTNSTGDVQVVARCSTANELALQFFNQSASSLTGSTQSAYLLQFRF